MLISKTFLKWGRGAAAEEKNFFFLRKLVPEKNEATASVENSLKCALLVVE